MGCPGQLDFVRRHRRLFEGPFLEIGARDYGSTADLRTLFPGQGYLGVDRAPGEGVDRVADLCAPFDEVERALDGGRFGTVFCLSVLEHCEQPFVMADNLTRLLRPGGRIYVSAPFAWKFHGFPSDYWRFTHEGIKKLFPRLAFDGRLDHESTARGEERPLGEELGRVPRRRPGRAVGAGLLCRLIGYRYMMAPTLINMVGVLPK